MVLGCRGSSSGSIGERQAQRFMRVAREHTLEGVEELGSVDAALRAIAAPAKATSSSDLGIDDGVPYRDPEAREAFRESCMLLAVPGGLSPSQAAALSWNDGAFRQWWLEGAPIRNMTDQEFERCMRTIKVPPG